MVEQMQQFYLRRNIFKRCNFFEDKLNSDDTDIREVLESLDDVVVQFLNYRYDIIEHDNYTDNPSYFAHKNLN